MAFARVHALVMTAPDDPAFENNPSDWNEDHDVSGADVGGIPYCPTATTETTSANLTYTEASGPRLQVGTSGTSTGWLLGYYGTSGQTALWNSALVASSTNYTLLSTSSATALNTAGNILFRKNNTTIGAFQGAAGEGFAITAGTATTDVNALSATQTWNAAGVAFTGWKFTITDTASAAGALAMQILGGASGTTSLFKVTKGGQVDAPSYAVGGAAGASFGPGAVTSITVVNGIVTAIS